MSFSRFYLDNKQADRLHLGNVTKFSFHLNYSFQCFRDILKVVMQSHIIPAVIIRKHGKRNPINEETLRGDEETACHTPKENKIYLYKELINRVQ